MIARFLLAVGLAVVMVVTGVTSYVYIGSRQTKVAAPIQKPPTATPKPEAGVSSTMLPWFHTSLPAIWISPILGTSCRKRDGILPGSTRPHLRLMVALDGTAMDS